MGDIGRIEKEVVFEPIPEAAPVQEPAAPAPSPAPVKEPAPV